MNYKKVTMFVFMSLTIFMVGCGSGHEEIPKGETAIPVSIETVKIDTIKEEFFSVSHIEARESYMIQAGVTEKVKNIFVKLGDDVKQGDALFEIDSANIEDKLLLNRTQALSELKRAKVNYESVQAAYERAKILYAEQAISKVAYETAKAAYKQGQINLELAKESYDVAVETSVVDMEKFTAYAPIDGSISSITIKVNEQVGVGEGINIIDDEKMIVKIPLPYNQVMKVDIGASGQVFLPSVNHSFDAKVTKIAEEIDEMSNTYLVTLEIIDEIKNVKNGMYAEVILNIDELENQVLVPQKAVVFEGEEAYIYKAQMDNTYFKVPVIKGIEQDGYVQINSKIKEGDHVIVKGQHYLTGTSEIVVVKKNGIGLKIEE